jgi:hypothetical protein
MTDVIEIRADGVDGPGLAAALVARAGRHPDPNSRDVLVDGLQASVDDLYASMANLQVPVDVRDQKIPIGNATWNRIKYQFHELVAIYVNELGGRQTAVNENMAVLIELVISRQAELYAQQADRIAALEEEVVRLRQALITQGAGSE